MKQKLIKLTDTHYIVVDDSDIKEGDFVLFQGNTIEIIKVREVYTNSNNDTFYKAVGVDDINSYYSKVSKKITHSTEPLEDVFISDTFKVDVGGFEKGFDKIQQLPLSEVEEAINGYSVEKMAKDSLNRQSWDTSLGLPFNNGYIKGYEVGFKVHQEIVRDKLFTVEDMIKAIRYGFDVGFCSNSSNKTKNNLQSEEQIIQSLLPKTEWDVEFVDGKIKLI